jgi:uncharacterized membrane protein YkvA (DUF1232 family)
VTWRILIAAGLGLAVAWIALIVFLVIARPRGSLLKEAMRILPDTIRLSRRLAADRSLPRRARRRLWLVLVYLAVPIDLVPDFLPLIGYADDAVMVAAALRFVVRAAGPDAVRRHWPGSADGLGVLWRLARLPGRPGEVT